MGERVLSESGFAGLEDFQDFCGGRVLGWRTLGIIRIGGESWIGRRVLSESGFVGLGDFQDFCGGRVFVWRALGVIRIGRKARVGRNGILKILPILKILILTTAREPAPSGAVTLILAFSHQGRRDLLVTVRAWFPAAILVGFWIPAFAGMTGWNRRARFSLLSLLSSTPLIPLSYPPKPRIQRAGFLVESISTRSGFGEGRLRL